MAPYGTATGDGSIQNPWNLQTALNHPTVLKAGDIIWLRGGTYGSGGASVFTSKLIGTKESPILVRNYEKERATINGGIYVYGNYTWFWGLEITNSLINRTGTASMRPPGLYILGTGIKAINLIIHETGHPGIGMQTEAGPDCEIYGGIIWGVGTFDTDYNGSPRGSAIYAQGVSDGVSPRIVRDVISMKNLHTGGKAYGEKATVFNNNFTFEGNVVVGNGDRQLFIAAGTNPVKGFRMINNYFYRLPTDTNESAWVGEPSFPIVNEDAAIAGNYFVGGTYRMGSLEITRWKNLQVTNNIIVSPQIFVTYNNAFFGLNWDNNQYFGSVNPNPFVLNGTAIPFASWKDKTKFDANSHVSPSRPTGTSIFVRKNLYEPDRANIIIYNWDKNPAVQITSSQLGNFIKAGDKYELRNGADYYHDIITGIYDGNSISIPMTGRTLASIQDTRGEVDLDSTFPEFGVFVLFNTSPITTTPINQIPTSIPTTRPNPSPILPTQTPTPTLRPTATPSPRPTATPTPRPTATPTPRPTATPTPYPITKKVFNAIADTYVRSADPQTNYGKDTIIHIDTSPDPIEKAYLKFDLIPLKGKQIISAKLQIYAINGSTQSIQIRGIDNISWNETAIKYTIRPPMSAVFTSMPNVITNAWNEVDLTSYVKNKAGQVFSIGMDTVNPDGIHFTTRETSTPPRLLVEYR